jgi:site-specific recombinase XerD
MIAIPGELEKQYVALLRTKAFPIPEHVFYRKWLRYYLDFWKAKLLKRVSAHTFRHSFATAFLQANYDIRTIQEMLVHSDVRTTMIYPVRENLRLPFAIDTDITRSGSSATTC